VVASNRGAQEIDMRSIHSWRDWSGDERGQGLAEYALILALIAIVAIVALIFLGEQVSAILFHVADSI
jgi:pilus assembly protein Flp/PilA